MSSEDATYSTSTATTETVAHKTEENTSGALTSQETTIHTATGTIETTILTTAKEEGYVLLELFSVSEVGWSDI